MKLFQFEREWRNRAIKHHRRLEDLLRAADENCPVCFRLVRELRRRGAGPILDQTDGYSDTHLRIKATQSRMCGLPSSLKFAINIHTTALESNGEMVQMTTEISFHGKHEGFEKYSLNDFAAAYRSKSNDSENITSTDMIDVEEWLKDYTEHHSCSNSIVKGYLPPRVLDCRTDQLVLKEASQIDLKGDTRYLTLSHCWGKGPNVTLQSDNMDELYQGIEYSRLPPTFRDAVKIVRKLNIAYLWIDSLCIIQKGPLHAKNWQKHVLEMTEI